MADQQHISEHQRQQITAALQAGIDPHQQAAAAAAAAQQPLPQQHSQQHFQPQDHIIQSFWNNQTVDIQNLETDFKNHPLPLARIKKVMKTDHDVKMISAEAPILFAKACEIFIAELTMRAWMHAEENKRRTLQKSDVAAAVSKSDQYDFLIDVVPRDEAGRMKRTEVYGQEHPYAYYHPTATVANMPQYQVATSTDQQRIDPLYYQQLQREQYQQYQQFQQLQQLQQQTQAATYQQQLRQQAANSQYPQGGELSEVQDNQEVPQTDPDGAPQE